MSTLVQHRLDGTRVAQSEKHFQRQVVELAETLGWKVNHTRPAVTGKGWKTPTTSKGFPDLTIARRGQVVFVELKTDTGLPSIEQLGWLRVLGPLGRIAQPDDLDDLALILTGRGTPPLALTWADEWVGRLAVKAATIEAREAKRVARS